jgi:peptide/nickel transport system substrate-binding protein
MPFRRSVVLLLLLILAWPAQARPFRFANDGDLTSLDPYGRNETLQLTLLGNVYEPLVRRTPSLGLEPALALSWSQTAPEIWRFVLRPNVHFQGGEPFGADDVVFSFTRANHPNSRMSSKVATVAEVRRIDDLTVDIVTKGPDPILPDEISDLYILSKAWAERNDAGVPANLSKNEEAYASRHANGTGPFIITDWQPDQRTNFVRNPNWWDTPGHNLDEVTFLPIGNPATRVAALVSGEVDLLYAVPPQDVERLRRTSGFKVLEKPELRVIFFAMDQKSDELRNSSLRRANPFKDIRVREALYRAIDIETIRAKVMRGASQPNALMIADGIKGFDPALNKRLSYDPTRAKQLLSDAGYSNGFDFVMDCPNDRYVNDEAICSAVVAMFARIGVKATLNAQPRSKHFAKVLNGESSFYMLGWTPSTDDAQNAIFNLMMTRDDKAQGSNNLGRFSDPVIDELGAKIAVELDPAQRMAMIHQALERHKALIGHLPLHQQTIVWAVRSGIDVAQFADNTFPLRLVTVH